MLDNTEISFLNLLCCSVTTYTLKIVIVSEVQIRCSDLRLIPSTQEFVR